MKKIWVLIFLLTAATTYAQKFGYVNSDVILNKMSEYGKANAELEQFTAAWQKEIEEKENGVTKLRHEYIAERILLTAEMKQKKEEEIQQAEKDLKEHQKKIFGYNGLYYLKKQELIKPLQEKISDAVEKVAKAHRLSVLFDKADDTVVMLYTDPRHDYTDFVLEELGLGDPTDKVK